MSLLTLIWLGWWRVDLDVLVVYQRWECTDTKPKNRVLEQEVPTSMALLGIVLSHPWRQGAFGLAQSRLECSRWIERLRYVLLRAFVLLALTCLIPSRRPRFELFGLAACAARCAIHLALFLTVSRTFDIVSAESDVLGASCPPS